MEVTVRRAKDSDKDAIVGLMQEFHEFSAYRDIPFSEADMRKWIDLLYGDLGIVQVAVAGSKVVGLVMGVIQPYTANHNVLVAAETALYVQGDYRGSGAGKKLVNQFEKIAKQKGASIVLLSALTDNLDRPRKLYEGGGYKLVEANFAKVVR